MRNRHLKDRADSASRFIDLIGDGTGSTDMTVNGSVTPVPFFIAPAPGTIIIIDAFILFLQDNQKFTVTGFGAGAALTNGLSGGLWKDGVGIVDDLLAQHPIKTNMDFGAYSNDTIHHDFGTTDEAMTITQSFTESIILREGFRFFVQINDDITSLVAMCIRMRARQVLL